VSEGEVLIETAYDRQWPDACLGLGIKFMTPYEMLRRERARFADIAVGSANEVEYQFLLGRDLQYLGAEEHEELQEKVVEVRKMLISLRKKLRASSR